MAMTYRESEPPLFPLPLTPFERYMLADDRPDYPMAFPAVVEFSGSLRRAEFDAALEGALREHPLLRARVDGSRRRPWHQPSCQVE